VDARVIERYATAEGEDASGSSSCSLTKSVVSFFSSFHFLFSLFTFRLLVRPTTCYKRQRLEQVAPQVGIWDASSSSAVPRWICLVQDQKVT
jgi:hypothetical protein